MPKKQRNELGQFISTESKAQNRPFLDESLNQKIFSFLMVIFLIILASPWLTIFFKSKEIQNLINAIIEFYNIHFIADGAGTNGFKTTKNAHGDI